jgi:hypothetical protein
VAARKMGNPAKGGRVAPTICHRLGHDFIFKRLKCIHPHKAPNPKLAPILTFQIPNNNQTSRLDLALFDSLDILNLEFIWNLGFGAWDLHFYSPNAGLFF